MKYLGVAVLGVGVLGVAVLGTAVLGVAVLGTAVLQHQYQITLNTALVHAASSHRTNLFMESHTTSRWSTDVEYLGVAVPGVGVLGVAVLGTAVLGVAVLGTAVLGVAVLGTAVLHHNLTRSARPWLAPHSSITASQSSSRKPNQRWPKQDGIPWCGRAGHRRARDRRAGRRRARDRRAAPHTHSFSPALACAPLIYQSIPKQQSQAQ